MGHTNQQDQKESFDQAKAQIDLQSLYFHYKKPDDWYRILGLGFIEATEEVAVIYEALYDGKLTWIRPITDFLAEVNGVDGAKTTRFKKVER